MSEHGITDWATATPAQNEQRQQNRTAAKAKCVLEQSALLKAPRAVVNYVGNTEMPKWSDGNKEAVESHAIELRHKLTQHLLRVFKSRKHRKCLVLASPAASSASGA
jgi:hypothetical protein